MYRYGVVLILIALVAFLPKFFANEHREAPLVISNQVQQGSSASSTKEAPWMHFTKPSANELRARLTPLQYEVTQEDGTEQAFNNAYYANEDEGLYVDIVSGEPLFTSIDKFDSGTGWPSFVRPISADAVTERTDTLLLESRTEIRSRYADSHLGHVFDDGPADHGGKRYCMNSAALRFIPKANLEREGYGTYLSFFMR